MTEVREQIDVDRDVRTVYNQWTQFEDFPEFMDGVESVEQIDDRHLRWKATVAGAEREWEAEITEQEPDRVIAWRAMGETRNDGRISFEPLGSDQTRVDVLFEYDPHGFTEKVGDALNLIERRVRGDLERFKEFIESRPAETGAWRGEIHGAETEPPLGEPGATSDVRPPPLTGTAAPGDEPLPGEQIPPARPEPPTPGAPPGPGTEPLPPERGAPPPPAPGPAEEPPLPPPVRELDEEEDVPRPGEGGPPPPTP